MEHMETERLILRPFRETDIEDVFDYARDEETVLYLTWETHKNLTETQQCLKDFLMQPNIFAIELKESGRCIGCFDLRHQEEHKKTSFGYVLNKAYWSKGYMSEALSAMLAYCFDTLGLNRVESTYYVGNEGSGKVMEKCGMRREGIGLQEVCIKGRLFDVVHMAILQQDWENAAGRQEKQ